MADKRSPSSHPHGEKTSVFPVANTTAPAPAPAATAEFKREDGAVFTISVDKFSPEDKAELQRIFAGTKP